MDKAGLRREIRARRGSKSASADFVDRVVAQCGAVVCCYVALPGEPPTQEVIEALLADGRQVFLPVAGEQGHMDWVDAADSRPWRAWGIDGDPPATTTLPPPDTVVVPALAVTPGGRRLGQGGGYYDRFLPGQPQARSVALVWSDEVIDDVCAEPHDVTVDAWVIADA